MPNRNGTGPSGLGSLTGRSAGTCAGSGQRPAQGADNPDWLVNLVGTLVLALGATVFRTLTGKLKSAPEKDVKTENEKKSEN